MEACGIDVFKTARHNGFDIDTLKKPLTAGTTLPWS
jgi:hypothetical protein